MTQDWGGVRGGQPGREIGHRGAKRGTVTRILLCSIQFNIVLKSLLCTFTGKGLVLAELRAKKMSNDNNKNYR